MNPLADATVQETYAGVFRLALPEIVLIGTACVAFLGGSLYNRRWLEAGQGRIVHQVRPIQKACRHVGYSSRFA